MGEEGIGHKGRKHPSFRRGPQIDVMQEKHHLIARYIFMGMKGRAIARLLNVSESHVSTVKNSPTVKKKLRLMRAAADRDVVDLQQRIAAVQNECFDLVMDEVVRNDQAPLELRAKQANNLLDRGGHAPVKKIEKKSATLQFTPEDIENLKKRAQEAQSSKNPTLVS
jgi:hypothetical protein